MSWTGEFWVLEGVSQGSLDLLFSCTWAATVTEGTCIEAGYAGWRQLWGNLELRYCADKIRRAQPGGGSEEPISGGFLRSCFDKSLVRVTCEIWKLSQLLCPRGIE